MASWFTRARLDRRGGEGHGPGLGRVRVTRLALLVSIAVGATGWIAGQVLPQAAFVALEPAETAAALADPERVDAGVRSLVANLGLGVYRASDLERLHEGSERGHDDVWLYDFQLHALAEMAASPAEPFVAFAERLAAVGHDQDASALLRFYREAYAGSTAFLPALFAAQELDLQVASEQLGITPLQAWLLLLDGFVPPNVPPGPAGAAAPRERVAREGLQRVSLGCSGIGGSATSNWGHVQVPRPPGMVDPWLLSDLMTAVYMMSRRLEPSFAQVHERHPDHDPGLPPHTLDFSATVAFERLPDVLVVCGDRLWLRFVTPVSGGDWGLRDVMVWWQVPDVLAFERGQITTADGARWFPGTLQLTDADGKAALTFDARDEPAEGEGVLRSELVTVTARFDVSTAMHQLLVGTDPTLAAFVPASLDPFPPLPIQVEIGWHEAAAPLSAFAIRHPMGWEKAYGLAGAHVGLVPWKVHDRQSLPVDLPLPEIDACGFWTGGMALEGDQVFDAGATAAAGTARMRTETAVDDDGRSVSIAFAGGAAAEPISTVASMALAHAETGAVSGDHTLAGPGMLVLDVTNPNPGEAFEVELRWSVAGDEFDPDDYASWWAEASLWVFGCGAELDARMLFAIDDEEPDPSSGVHVVRSADDALQLHLLLEAGVFAHAFEVSHEPDVVSRAQIEGELSIVVRGAAE